jgi:signal transduction histidine kinase
MDSQDRLQSFGHLLSHLREPLVLVTPGGEILASNVAAAEALATSVAALRGGVLSGYAPDPARLAAQLAAVRAGSPPTAFPLRARDGRRFFCDASELEQGVLLLRLSGGPEPEPRLRAFHATLSRIDAVGDEGLRAPTLEEVATAVLRQGMTAFGNSAGSLFLLDETGSQLELRASVGVSDENFDRYRIVPLTAALPLVDSFKGGTPVLLGTPEDYAARYPAYALAHPDIAKRATGCLPLQLDGRTLGILAVGYPAARVFGDAERARMQAHAATCAEALERARLVDAERAARRRAQRSASQLDRLHAFTGALAQAISWAQVVEAVVDMGMVASGARSGGLWLLDDGGAHVSLARSVGPTGPTADAYISVPLDPPARMPILDAIRNGTPIWIESCRQMGELYPAVAHAFSTGGESSLACLPLFAQGRCIGGLALNHEGVRRFHEDERSFLQVLSWYSAQALERARLYSVEQQARATAEANQRRSAVLADAGTILATSLDLQTTLAGVARAAVPRVADWCIVELDEERQKDVPAVAAHVDPTKTQLVRDLSLRFRQLGTGHGIPGVIRSGRSVLYRSIDPSQVRVALSADPGLAELYCQSGLASAMVVPISAGGRTLGAILLVSSRADRLYGDEDLALAEELGRGAGLAVENARLYREVREADRLKDEFLAMLGHELRNPLSPIVTALDLMNLSSDRAFERERTIMTRQVQQVVRLVDDLLDVSRITRGKIQLRPERTEAAQVIAKAMEMAGPILQQRRQRLKITVPTRGLPLNADRERLPQAVANLLTNAAKYTEPGNTVSLSAAIEGNEAVVRVEDPGIGIAAEMLPRIFDLFVQAPGALDRAQGGLGVGLTVVRKLVELHGGSVSAHSAGLGRGSAFVLRLPLARD